MESSSCGYKGKKEKASYLLFATLVSYGLFLGLGLLAGVFSFFDIKIPFYYHIINLAAFYTYFTFFPKRFLKLLALFQIVFFIFIFMINNSLPYYPLSLSPNTVAKFPIERNSVVFEPEKDGSYFFQLYLTERQIKTTNETLSGQNAIVAYAKTTISGKNIIFDQVVPIKVAELAQYAESVHFPVKTYLAEVKLKKNEPYKVSLEFGTITPNDLSVKPFSMTLTPRGHLIRATPANQQDRNLRENYSSLTSLAFEPKPHLIVSRYFAPLDWQLFSELPFWIRHYKLFLLFFSALYLVFSLSSATILKLAYNHINRKEDKS